MKFKVQHQTSKCTDPLVKLLSTAGDVLALLPPAVCVATSALVDLNCHVGCSRWLAVVETEL